jgi:hypothetical protein
MSRSGFRPKSSHSVSDTFPVEQHARHRPRSCLACSEHSRLEQLSLTHFTRPSVLSQLKHVNIVSPHPAACIHLDAVFTTASTLRWLLTQPWIIKNQLPNPRIWSRDALVPADYVRVLANLSGAKFHFLKGRGHNILLEPGWRGTANVISDWLASH